MFSYWKRELVLRLNLKEHHMWLYMKMKNACCDWFDINDLIHWSGLPLIPKYSNFFISLVCRTFIKSFWKVQNTKVTRLISFLKCNLHNSSKELKELSYKQFVLSVLKYAATVWDPYHLSNIHTISVILIKFQLEEILDIV